MSAALKYQPCRTRLPVVAELAQPSPITRARAVRSTRRSSNTCGSTSRSTTLRSNGCSMSTC